MRKLSGNRVFVLCLLVALAGCGGGSGKSGKGGIGGATGAGGMAASAGGGTGGAIGAAGSGGSGTGGSDAGGGGIGGATGAAGTGGTASCIGYDIDIPSTLVTGTFKINGTTVTSATDWGNLFLSTGAGDSVKLGSTAAGSYSVRVVPGTYDLLYAGGASTSVTVPRNIRATLRSVAISGTGTTLDIDIPSVVLTGTIKINGTSVTSTTDEGVISLKNAAGDGVNLGDTSSGSYSVRVVPGTYDIYYSAAMPGATAPRNQSAKLQSVVVAATGTTTMDVDVPSVVLSGMLKVNGAANTSTADAGIVTLRTASGDYVFLGSTSTGSYSVRVVPGTYDIYYSEVAAGTQAPRNGYAKLQSVVVAATGTTVIDIDVPSVVLSGTLKINGTTVTATDDYGVISLRTAGGDSVGLSATSSGAYSVPVIPGSYDVYYKLGAAGATAPGNQSAKLKTVTIPAAGTTLDVDVPSVVVSGMLTINGTTVTSTTDAGNLSLETAAGDSVSLGSTSAGSYSVRAIPGTYDVYFQGFDAGATAPHNLHAKILSGAVVATGTTALDIDVPASSPVTGSIRINGMTSTTDYGNLMLRGGADSVFLGPSYPGTYDTRIIPGNYELFYQVGISGALAPANQLAEIRCFTVQ